VAVCAGTSPLPYRIVARSSSALLTKVA
jgi:hypothetical protein